MKKLILFLGAAAVAAMITGCAKVDYGCVWDFIILNQTNSDTFILDNGEVRGTITHGEKQTIYEIDALCGKNSDPLGDFYQNDDQIMLMTHSSNVTVQIQIDDKIMPEIIFKRKYWDFVATGNYSATYTLIITDELIETIENK